MLGGLKNEKNTAPYSEPKIQIRMARVKQQGLTDMFQVLNVSYSQSTCASCIKFSSTRGVHRTLHA